ncbi:glycosyl hydrolase 108 family protein [Flavobacterium praedii]|uniref:glycosyl hydrolase 108 family protein n=1 Tax=Flavobacterium praedii TaxID=3002900 RepID=UPI002481B0BC|nr:glycosyl hydrolase 108 family protein [Flavobacterium praedii]
MSELKITGNPAPVVGKEESYSVSQLLPTSIPTEILNGSKPNPFEFPVEWSVHVLENGKWIKKEENNKTGNKVSYKFIQKSLERKGIRILAKKGEQTARLDVKPHNAESPKIDSIEFLDKNGNKPTKPFAYGQILKARVHCLHMERRTVYATLWEDDAAGAGHNKANEKNKMKTLPGIVKNGIADIDFVLEPDFAKIANAVKAKSDADEGKTHEYYVTAEILNKKTASTNTNVANPSYKDTTAKPGTPKKETPAQKKGPSKKQEKEKSIGDEITDWWEGLFKVKPIVAPNPKPPTGNNPLKVGEPDKNPKDEKKEGTCCGEKFCIKKGDKSELIREINIRLAGFGGNVPTDEFTDRTEKMIKQFQRDYMKVPETGKICGNVLKAIDDFSQKFEISQAIWNTIDCSCSTKGSTVQSKLRGVLEKNNCNGWGDSTGKGTYKVGNKEKDHKYEYPGVHRSLLFGFKTILFYLSKQTTYNFAQISSGYRCRFKNFKTTNHQGKALDIQFNKGNWEIKGAQEKNLVPLRDLKDSIFLKYLNAKTSWTDPNNFSLEPIDLKYDANGDIDNNYTYSWIHLDVREFDPIYLDDKYFCKNASTLNSKNIVQIAKDTGFEKTCNCLQSYSPPKPPITSPLVVGTCEDKFKKVAPIILRHEGGYVNHPSDKGGPTNKGITLKTWEKYAKDDIGLEPTLDNLKNITDEQATIIYRKHYWEPKGFCKIKDETVSLMIYDWTITSGGAIKEVQKLLVNEFEQNITIDGGIGTNTINAINNVTDQDKLLKKISKIRKQYYTDLTFTKGEKNSQDVFLGGWLNRVDDCLKFKP